MVGHPPALIQLPSVTQPTLQGGEFNKLTMIGAFPSLLFFHIQSFPTLCLHILLGSFLLSSLFIFNTLAQNQCSFFFFFWLSLGLCCCLWAFSSCGEWGLLFLLWCVGFSLRWLLLLQSTGSRWWASVVAACGLSSCGSWDLEHVGFSSCGLRALERRLSSCGAQA